MNAIEYAKEQLLRMDGAEAATFRGEALEKLYNVLDLFVQSNPTHFENVTRWHDERGLPGKANGVASFEDVEYRKRRARLIAEEFCEAMEALGFRVVCEISDFSLDKGVFEMVFAHYSDDGAWKDPVAFLDALADMGVVIEGSASELGYDYDEARRRVQDSNDTKPTTRDENGKIVKGPNYIAPELADLVR